MAAPFKFFRLGLTREREAGDWREDYRTGNWTPFLRDCVAQMGAAPKDEAQLERFIYLTGAYERWGSMVADGLRQVGERLRTVHARKAEGLITIVDRCRDQAEVVVANFRAVKSGKSTRDVPATLQ